MSVRRTTPVESAFGLDIDPATRAVILIEERLRNMEAQSAERAKVVDRIEASVTTQQTQINQVVTDMAVLKTQHASLWKGAAILFSALSLIGGAIGWAVGQLVTIMRH